MDNITLFRGSAFATLSFLIIALVTPIATIAIDLAQASNALEILEFVCVYCQYGSTDNNPNGTALILNLTSIDFYFMWIPIILILGLAVVPVLKSFPLSKWGQKIPDRTAINLLWVIAVLSIGIRAILSLLVTKMENEYQSIFPENYVKGELGWGAAALIFATIAAVSAAMFGFIEFQYELEENDTLQSEPTETKLVIVK